MKKSCGIMRVMSPLVNSPIFLALVIWTTLWRALASWRAARSGQRNWFIAFFIPINTAGILEIIYLVKFAKNPLTLDEIRSWVQSKPTSKKK